MNFRFAQVGVLCIVSAFSLLDAPSSLGQNQQPDGGSAPPPTTPATAQPSTLPNLPASSTLPDTPSAANQSQTSGQPSNLRPQTSQAQQPSGTAAAEGGKVSGTAVSRPAGVAIAPSKQKRSRSFVLKLGLIAGAGVALGTVAALSAGSPSKPPGAH